MFIIVYSMNFVHKTSTQVSMWTLRYYVHKSRMCVLLWDWKSGHEEAGRSKWSLMYYWPWRISGCMLELVGTSGSLLYIQIPLWWRSREGYSRVSMTNNVCDITIIQSFFYRRYRFIAYHQLVGWCWGWLGRRVRVVLPSCAVNKIRTTFPSATYAGFKYPST